MTLPDPGSSMDLFSKLRTMREEKGLQLEDIAQESRIQIRYLQAIESGDILALPAAYDHLFFRAYLKALGVDEQEYMEQFYEFRRMAREKKSGAVIHHADKTVKWNNAIGYKTMLKSKNLLVLIPFAIVLIILIFLLSSTRSIQTEYEEPVKEIDIQSIAASMQPPAPVDTVDTTLTIETNLNLLIYGLRTTWFRIVKDKRDTAEYLLKRGNQLTANAGKTYEFIIGRADGLQFKLNDKPPQVAGTDSQVVSYLLIDSSGIVAKIFKQPQPIFQPDSTVDSTNEIQ